MTGTVSAWPAAVVDPSSLRGARVAGDDIEPSAVKAAARRIERNGGVGMALAGDVDARKLLSSSEWPAGRRRVR
jgi:hypothetical protein